MFSSLSHISKSSNDFSFLSTFFDLIENKDFGNQRENTLCAHLNTQYTNIWNTLSAVAEQVGGAFQENVNNFIDNVSNVELCKVRQLQSLITFTGTNYNVFNIIQTFPIEIQNLLDILSIKREYLLNSRKINKYFIQLLSNESLIDNSLCISNSISAASSISNYRNSLSDASDLSTNWCSFDISNISYIDDNKYANLISGLYYDTITSNVCATYNDYGKSLIYEVLSDSILLSSFDLQNYVLDKAEKAKLLNNIDKSFDVEKEADKVQSLSTTIDDYSEYEKNLIELELKRRTEAFVATLPYTRYKYNKELKVKEYFAFVENEYIDYAEIYANVLQYDFDNQYFQVFDNSDDNRCLIYIDDETKKLTVHVDWIVIVVQLLVKITKSIIEIREQIKTQCLKNFMKGTFIILSYLINEYLKSNIVPSIENIEKHQIEYNLKNNTNSIIEYYDSATYFNISSTIDYYKNDNLNDRFWEGNARSKSMVATDNTNIFQSLNIMDSSNFTFSTSQIESFYKNILKANFSKYLLSSKADYEYGDYLFSFLCCIFDLQADSTKVEDNKLIYIGNQELSSYKKELYDCYTGEISSLTPYYYIENSIHPSYQIHPMMETFVEKSTLAYPINNIANVTYSNVSSILKLNIDEYIDDEGYISNEWRSPFMTNSNYLSRYEAYDHTDINNNLNEVYGYDGLFYPSAIDTLINNKDDLTALIKLKKQYSYSGDIKNYYYGVDLTNAEIDKIIKQIDTFYNDLTSLAKPSTSKFIYRYGLDKYENAYILVKDSDSYDADGTLWIRLKNHPYSFPAYAKKTSDEYNDNDVALLRVLDSEANVGIKYAKLAKLQRVNYSTYCIKDFFITKDKSFIILNVSTESGIYPIIASISQTYNKLDEMHYLSLNKINSDVESFLTFTDEDDKNVSAYYKFDLFFENDDNELGLFFHRKLTSNTIDIQARYIDNEVLQTDATEVNLIYKKQCTGNSIKLDFSIRSNNDNDDIALNINNDNTLEIAYLADTTIENIKNYAEITSTYSLLETYIRTLISQPIAVQKFITTGKTILMLDIEEEYEQHKAVLLYAPYTDNGFFGIYTGINLISKTMISNTEFDKRGMYMFLLLGPSKKSLIDFKLCLPVKMQENYKLTDHIDESLSLACYQDAHFDEDGSVYFNKISSDNRIYEPIELLKILKGTSTTLRVQEEFFELLSANKDNADNRLYDYVVDAPYLWYGSSDNRKIPAKFVNPKKQNAEDDTFFIDLLPYSVLISASWGKNSDQTIALNFNTYYYTDSNCDNYFNEKRSFLNLDKPGNSGYLNTYTSMSNTTSVVDKTYYIKNISDEYPKFLISIVNKEESKDTNEQALLLTEDGNYAIETQDSNYLITTE